jgi:hypothetical protein
MGPESIELEPNQDDLGFLSIVESNTEGNPSVRACDCTDTDGSDSGIDPCVDADSCFDACDSDVDSCTDTGY